MLCEFARNEANQTLNSIRSHSGNLTIHMIKHVDEKASKSDQNDFDMQNSKSMPQHQQSVEQAFSQTNNAEQQSFSQQQFDANHAYKANEAYKVAEAFKSELYRHEALKTEFYGKELAQASMIYHRDHTQPENFSSQLIRFTQEKYPSNSKF